MATDDFMYDRLITEFSKFEGITIVKNIFQNLNDADCLVSPANSFGLMDGGMDAAITQYFGDQLQQRVQKHIIENYYGEQPVGTSFIIETNNETIPYLAHTPTMRVPMSIKNTDNIYMAMRATLMECEKDDRINAIAIPSFGYGAGMVHAKDVAYQMAKAYLQVLSQPKGLNWDYARSVQYALNR